MDQHPIVIDSVGLAGSWAIKVNDGTIEKRKHAPARAESRHLPHGTHTLLVPPASPTTLAFEVDDDGNVVIDDDLPVRAVDATLVLLLQTYWIVPKGGVSKWAINGGNTSGRTAGSAALLPGTTVPFELHIDGETVPWPIAIPSTVHQTQTLVHDDDRVAVYALGT